MEGQNANLRRHCLKVGVASLLTEIGFESAENMALETLSEMLQSFITELGSSTRSYCELAGRTQPMVCDVIVALVDLGVGVDGLEAYAMRPNRTVLPGPTQATQPKQLGILQAGVKQTPPSHIPPHLPPFPDPHAYIRTPTHKQPVTEYEAIREKAASQKRDLERALTRFVAKTGETHSLFLTEDNQMFPLVACKPEVPAYLKALLPQDQVFDFEDEFGVPSISSPRAPRKTTPMRGDDVDMEDDDDGEESKEEGKTAEVDAIDNPYLRAVKLPRNNKRPSVDGRAMNMDLRESSSKRNLLINSDNQSDFGMDWLSEGVDNIALMPHRSVSWYTSCATDLCLNSVPLRGTRSYTGTIDDGDQSKLLGLGSLGKTDEEPTRTTDSPQCPCGCLQRPPKEPQFRTHEANSMKLFSPGKEILQFQGRTYSSEQIAPIWKKDCRTWLWKSKSIGYKCKPTADM